MEGCIIILSAFFFVPFSFQIPDFVEKGFKQLKSGEFLLLFLIWFMNFVCSGVAKVGASIPDPQDALTFVPRVLIETKHNIDKKLISQEPDDVRFLLYEDKQ